MDNGMKSLGRLGPLLVLLALPALLYAQDSPAEDTDEPAGSEVATEIDEVYDADAAKDQLGHTSKTVTERHYINRRLVVPDYRAATERLAPRSDPPDDSGIGP